MKNLKVKILGTLLLLILAGLYYYVTLPAINIHATGFWLFIIVLIIAMLVAYIIRKRLDKYEIKESKQ